MQGRIRPILSGLSFALALAFAGPSRAIPLDLVLLETPDLVSGFIDVTYGASTDRLLAIGFALELSDASFDLPLTVGDGAFELGATIGDDGTLSDGSLSIGGTIADLGFLSGSLLTADLTRLGYPEGEGDVLEFLARLTGGDAAGLYGGVGAVVGLILHDTGFAGFDSDFDNLIAGFPSTGSGTSDVAPIPEPSTLLLFSLGVAGLGGLGSKRRRRERPLV